MELVELFLQQSNWIEREYSTRAFFDAVKAWDYAFGHKKEPMSLKHILKIHKILMKNVNPRVAGVLRKCDVYIGGMKKEYTSLFKLKSQVLEFIKDYECIISRKNKMDVEELELAIRKNHVLFENVHPFADGNGRTGRILYNLLREKCGLPIHVIHGWADKEDVHHPEQAKYYQWFIDKEKQEEIIFKLLSEI